MSRSRRRSIPCLSRVIGISQRLRATTRTSAWSFSNNWADRRKERGRLAAASPSTTVECELLRGLGEIGLGRLGDVLDVLEALLAVLVFVVVEVLERELLGGNDRHFLVLVGTEHRGKRTRFRQAVQLLTSRSDARPRRDELADDWRLVW